MRENEEENAVLSDNEIFTKIWSSPRQVFRFINDNGYDKYATALLLLAGISRAFDQASLKDMGDRHSLGMIVAMCIIAGGLFGWMSYWLYAALISWTGKWLNAQGDTKSILRVISYASLPSVIALVFLAPQIIIYGNEIFKSEGDVTSGGVLANLLVYSSMVVEFVLAIWTIIFCVIGISEVQKLSVGKSILNLLLPVIVLIVPMILIVLLISRPG